MAKLIYPMLDAPGGQAAGRLRIGLARICVANALGEELDDLFDLIRVRRKSTGRQTELPFPVATKFPVAAPATSLPVLMYDNVLYHT